MSECTRLSHGPRCNGILIRGSTTTHCDCDDFIEPRDER